LRGITGLVYSGKNEAILQPVMKYIAIIRSAWSWPTALLTFLIAVLSLLLAGVHQTLSSAESALRQSLSVVVFMQQDLTTDQAAQWAQTLQAVDRDVISWTFTSKNQAYTDSLADPTLSKALMLLGDNPLPSFFTLHYRDRAWKDRMDPTETINKQPLVQEIRWDAEGVSIFRAMSEWRRRLMQLTLVSIAVFLAWFAYGLQRSLQRSWNPSDFVSRLVNALFTGGSALLFWHWAVPAPSAGLPPVKFMLMAWVPILAACMTAIAALTSDKPNER
jgi:hypothetical protein